MSNKVDHGWYNAIICTKYPAYNTQSVLICIPSQGICFTLLTGYHTDVCCTNTFDAHSITNAAVERESLTQKKEWSLLVFPPGTMLDNTMFSHHSTFFKKRSIKLRAPENQNGFVEAHPFTIGVLQSLALENNVVWLATMTSMWSTQKHNTIWTISHSATLSTDNRNSNIIDQRSVVVSNL
jgi:hypothetical protein